MGARHILAVVQSDLQLICLLRGVLEANGFRTVSIARNSQEAILYLRGVGIYQDRLRYPLPSTVILDSQNPDIIDLEVLAFMRERSWLKSIPLVLLCAEKHGGAHAACALDAACFIVDRGDLNDLMEAISSLEVTVTAA